MNADVVIVGAGFAGAATAYHLSRPGSASILMLEREQAPGLHSSGRNASLLLQSGSNALVRRLTVLSLKHYQERAERLGFRESGSIQTGSRATLQALLGDEGIESCWISPQEAVKQVPQLEGSAFQQALLTPGDGVMDIARLMDFYLSGARQRGARLLTSAPVTEISGRGPFRIRAGCHFIEAARIVDAAGAWASHIASLAGLPVPALTPKKRHLFHLEAGNVSARQPFLWDQERDFYFRPQGNGLLFSLCDEEADSSLDTTPSPHIEERLQQHLKSHLPSLSGRPPSAIRACFRTHSADGEPLIGAHPQCADFLWVAALGGFGMGASWEIGRRAAQALLGG
ncbi:MAG TPA: FAD-dependent oxidoreductase [Acidobacteriota bacterium]|nr:FAD-dependent oxidoreductase [Acidobacteriota bacterium]